MANKRKGKDENAETFVVTFKLKTEKWQEDILDKRFEFLRRMYNYAQHFLLGQYNNLKNSEEYKLAEERAKESKKYVEKGKKKNKKAITVEEYKNLSKEEKGQYEEKCDYKPIYDLYKTYTFTMKGINDRDKKPLQITFTEYGITNFVSKLCQKSLGNKTYLEFGINSIMSQCLGKNIWAAWDKILFSPAKKIHFKRFGELNTFSVRLNKGGFIGMLIDLKNGKILLKRNNRNGKHAEWMTIPLDTANPTDYEMYALKGGEKSIRVVTIARKFERKNKYYVQFSIEGEKPQKGRTLGKGKVGMDLGPSTVAVSSNNGVQIDTLAQNYVDIQAEERRISRKMDRSRRANNPQCYNENGTFKKGERLTNFSKRYLKLKNKLKDLRRKGAAVRKLEHNIRANEILKLGDTFITEKDQFDSLKKKAKETKVNEKGKFQSKKRFGKSIGNHAPSAFKTILKNKVKSLGGEFIEVSTKNAASQFDFTNGEFTPHKLKERNITLSNGNTHQRDLLAAFNLQHIDYNNKDVKQYFVENMERDYPIFCTLERRELDKYRNGEKISRKSTIGI